MVADALLMPIAPVESGVADHGISAFVPSLPAAEGFACLLGDALAQVWRTLDAASAADIEGIHHLRVGVRRGRAILALFKPLLIASAAERFDERLQAAGRIFGAARDWDVFVTETLPQAGKDGVTAAVIDALTDATRVPRAKAHSGLQRELGGGGFLLLLAGLTAWADDGRASPALLGGHEMAAAMADIGPKLMARLQRRMTKRAKRLRQAAIPDLHRLRKAVKTYRYAAEGVGPAYPRKSVKAAIRAAKELQDLLGGVNDAAAIAALTHEAGIDASSELAPALAALRVWAEQRSADARTDVPKAWHALRDAAAFW